MRLSSQAESSSLGPVCFKVSEQVTPRFATEPVWRALSGMSRSRTYVELATGNLKGKKLGARLLIDVEHGLRWLESLPPATFRAPKAAA